MTVIRVNEPSPTYYYNTSDLIGGTHFAGSSAFLGAKCFNVDTQAWGTIGAGGLIVAGYSLPVTVSASSVTIGKVAIDQTTDGTTNAVHLTTGTNSIGKLAANSGVDIGDVTLTAGSAVVGATLDGGPSQTLTRTSTLSADMQTAAPITPAPVSGQKVVAMDIFISTDTAMNYTIQMETSAVVLAKVYLPANGSVALTLRGFIKGDTADKRLYGKASVAGNVSIVAVTFSEA